MPEQAVRHPCEQIAVFLSQPSAHPPRSACSGMSLAAFFRPRFGIVASE